MKNNQSDTQILPPELIREILLRLPVKSLLRLKCVCKSWLFQISEPQFGVSHFDLAASPSHRLLLPSNFSYFQSIDIDAALSVPLLFRLPTPPNEIQLAPEIVGSCRGFVLLYCATTCDLILWNPSIGVHKRLSRFQILLTLLFLYGFGYDVSTDDYLIILIGDCKTTIQVYSFKTNSRNAICIDVPYHPMGSLLRAGWVFNGTLHWLVFSLRSLKPIPVIIAFDLRQRSLSEIPLFKKPGECEWLSLMEMGGCLGVCCMNMRRAETEIWVMKEYKMQSSWTKSVVILTNCFSSNFFCPICITKDGGILGSSTRNCLEKFNDKGERLEHLTYHSSQKFYLENLPTTYRESLLSLSSVIGANE